MFADYVTYRKWCDSSSVFGFKISEEKTLIGKWQKFCEKIVTIGGLFLNNWNGKPLPPDLCEYTESRALMVDVLKYKNLSPHRKGNLSDARLQCEDTNPLLSKCNALQREL
jgi:hypothetical protein